MRKEGEAGKKGKKKQAASVLDASALTINVLRGKSLAKKNAVMGKSDPYVEVWVGGSHFKTQTLKNTLNPEWGFTRDVVLFDPTSDVILFQVWDWNRLSKDEFMGEARFAVSEIQYDTTVSLSLTKRTPSDVSVTGHIEVQFRQCHNESKVQSADLDFNSKKFDFLKKKSVSQFIVTHQPAGLDAINDVDKAVDAVTFAAYYMSHTADKAPFKSKELKPTVSWETGLFAVTEVRLIIIQNKSVDSICLTDISAVSSPDQSKKLAIYVSGRGIIRCLFPSVEKLGALAGRVLERISGLYPSPQGGFPVEINIPLNMLPPPNYLISMSSTPLKAFQARLTCELFKRNAWNLKAECDACAKRMLDLQENDDILKEGVFIQNPEVFSIFTVVLARIPLHLSVALQSLQHLD